MDSISRLPEYRIVMPFTTMGKLKAHPSYLAAKSGDTDAAYRLVADLMRGKRQLQKLEYLKQNYQGAIIVGVHAVEPMGINKIPQILARYIGKITGLEVNGGSDAIVQSVKVGRTGSDAIYRLAYRPKYEGTVKPGQDYLLVDDVITVGGTINELRYFIEKSGGTVVQMACMGAAQFSTNITLSEKTKQDLLNKYDIMSLQEFLIEERIYDGNPLFLSESEARTIIRAGSLDGCRNRITQRRLRENK